MQICSSLSLHARYSIISLIVVPDAREQISHHPTAKRSHTLRLTLTPELPATARLPGTHKGGGISPESLGWNKVLIFHPNTDQLFCLWSVLLLLTLCSWHSSVQELNATCVSSYQSAAPTLRKEYVQKHIAPVLSSKPAPRLHAPLSVALLLMPVESERAE